MSTALIVAGPSEHMGAPVAAVTSVALEKFMVPLRAGDPLGLGVERPPPPPDPDVYDRSAEDLSFSRSTLSSEERQAIDEDIEKKGYMQIGDVRLLIAQNTNAALTESSGLDPEMIIFIDARINYKVFIVGDNIYTREELYENFALHELDVQPEAVFSQQEIGIFPAEKYSMNPSELCYVARDVGDETVEFITTEDMVGLAARKNYKMCRQLLRAVKTKIYVGKQPWRDFEAMAQLARGTVRLMQFHCAKGGGRQNFLAALMGAPHHEPKLLVDPETLAAEKKMREKEHAQRTEELRIREAELKEREDRLQRLIDDGIARLTEKFTGNSSYGITKTAPAKGLCGESKTTPVKSPRGGSKTTPAKASSLTPLSVKKPQTSTTASEANYDVLFAEMFPDGDAVPL